MRTERELAEEIFARIAAEAGREYMKMPASQAELQAHCDERGKAMARVARSLARAFTESDK